MIQGLAEGERLIYEKYRGIKLTDKGISIAIVIRNRHGLLFEFFKLRIQKAFNIICIQKALRKLKN